MDTLFLNKHAHHKKQFKLKTTGVKTLLNEPFQKKSFWFLNICVETLLLDEHAQLKKKNWIKKRPVWIPYRGFFKRNLTEFLFFLQRLWFLMSMRSLKNKTKIKKASVNTLISFFKNKSYWFFRFCMETMFLNEHTQLLKEN